jgi:FkbM family methyltransferase
MNHPQTNSIQLRTLVRRTARRAGVEEQLLRGYAAVFRALESPTVRRNRRDDERVRCVAAAALAEDSNCIDIGANEGLHLSLFVELAPRGRHIAYEPVPALSAKLASRFPHVDVRRAAVSDQPGSSMFVVHKQLASRSSLRSVGYPDEQTESIETPVETLDSSLPSGYVPRLIKVDIEGAEHLALRGGIETLREHKPMIIFEHQQATASHYQTGPDEIFDLLVDELEMRIFDMDGQGPYTRRRLREAYDTGSRWNFFAVAARGGAARGNAVQEGAAPGVLASTGEARGGAA